MAPAHASDQGAEPSRPGAAAVTPTWRAGPKVSPESAVVARAQHPRAQSAAGGDPEPALKARVALVGLSAAIAATDQKRPALVREGAAADWRPDSGSVGSAAQAPQGRRVASKLESSISSRSQPPADVRLVGALQAFLLSHASAWLSVRGSKSDSRPPAEGAPPPSR